MSIVSHGSIKWRFTGFYGSPFASDRNFSWDLLQGLKDLGMGPWRCGGDFSMVLSYSEKVGGSDKTALAILNFCLAFVLIVNYKI